MRKIFFGAIAVLLTFVFSEQLLSQAKPLKVGVVDLKEIIDGMPEAQQADKELKELTKKYQDTLMQMQTDLEEQIASYQKQKGMMAPEKQQEEEQRLQAIQMEFYQYREEIFGQQGKLARLNMNYLEPIREKINVAIEKIAEQEEISLVLDMDSSAVLFAEDKFDITYRVLDLIKRGSGE